MRTTGFEEAPDDFEVPDHTDMWYDRHTRSWIVQLKDRYGNQIGDATYVYSKREATAERKYLQEKHGLRR